MNNSSHGAALPPPEPRPTQAPGAEPSPAEDRFVPRGMALPDNEELFRKVFEHSNDAIFIIDPERDQILEVNPSACRLLQYTREELLVTPVSAIHPNNLTEARAFASSVMKEGHGWTNEMSCVTKNGETVFSEASASTIQFQGRTCLIGMLRNITQRKQAEVALRESQHRYQTLAKVSPALIFRRDPAGRCVYVNERWTEWTGLPSEAALGDGWLQSLHPDDRQRVLEERRAAEQSGADLKVEFRLQHVNGTSRWMLVHVATERREDGGIIGYVGTCLDITEFKRAGQLELENSYLREEVLEAGAFGCLVGQSSALHAVSRQIELVAPTDASVLILGESGTGKELVAREIHQRSKRSQRPLIRVNCASIPKELYESEFFGHAKGAFTGAVKDRAGRFEAADGGTLFLDEVGEIPLDLQSKLLRVLQEGQYERIGEERTRRVNVRIIAATNRDLKTEVAAGRFRQDLYYRLNVFPIEVAPLRQRHEDIPLLAAHFLQVAVRKLNCRKPRLTQANIIQLQSYDWPGNVRELQNVIERAAILSRRGELHFDLPDISGTTAPGPTRASIPVATEQMQVVPEIELRRRERENLLAALEKAGWQIYGAGGAAELLGIKPTTLISRMKKLRLKKPE